MIADLHKEIIEQTYKQYDFGFDVSVVCAEPWIVEKDYYSSKDDYYSRVVFLENIDSPNSQSLPVTFFVGIEDNKVKHVFVTHNNKKPIMNCK